jgi:saccharopine dehydrogenase (NAD+, L-lysine forming)
MNQKIGIRHEDKYVMERRVAIPPAEVEKLIKEGLEVFVETSHKRIFTDDEYRKAGAKVTNCLADCPVIFGVKEMPSSFFEMNKTYIFFSHVIKGQTYNMPMLRQMMDKKCTLIDYEKIADNQGRRLIFFGRFAGLAGMINSLWSFGQRMKVQGMETPFLGIRQSHKYNSLADAEMAVKRAGEIIRKEGLHKSLVPFTIGFTGYGNVSKGAQHIADLLPTIEISPDDLLNLKKSGKFSNKTLYKVVFKEEDLSEPIDPSAKFHLQEYYNHPERFKNQFEKYADHLTILMNCMYWDDRYPKLLSKTFIRELYNKGELKMKVIGDVTCDPDGSVEFTHKGTEIEDPVFVYNPVSEKPTMGFEGEGILVMAVDILPSELPRESSESFGQALLKFIPSIARADYSTEFSILDLPSEIKRAVILHQGQLTPDYQYISQYL